MVVTCTRTSGELMAITTLLAARGPAIVDDVLRLAAAADVEVQVAGDAGQARAGWPRAPLVVIDAAMAGDLASDGLPRRPGVVLVTAGSGDADVYRRAVEVGAQHVAVLPHDEAWLVDALAAAARPQTRGAVTVCVTPARGGAGASVLAAALALAACRHGLRSLLVDADRLGGGVHLPLLPLGDDDEPGARWHDFDGRRGRLGTAVLDRALPVYGDLRVLSWRRGDSTPVSAETMVRVLDAAQRGFDLIVVDVPREPDAAGEAALRTADEVLLVVPPQVRATMAAALVTAGLRHHARRVRPIVAGPSPGGLGVGDVAAALGSAPAESLVFDRRVAAAVENGELPRTMGRGSLARLCGRLIGELAARHDRRVA